MIGSTKPIDADATRARCTLPPFPNGWWIVELSGNLRPGRLVERRWMGRLIVAWRDREGTVCVADAYCPHMGAGLSPSAGGRLYGDRLRCPFHGFEYDTSGACVATPNARPPRACSLQVYETCEISGFVFAYFGGRDRAPEWRLPPLDEAGWSGIRVRRIAARTHPQDMAENSVDIDHLQHVHGWENGRQTAKARVEGRYYTAGFGHTGRLTLPGMRHIRYETDSTVHVWGMGFVYTESEAPNFGVQVRNWFLASPVDGEYFEAFIAIQIKRLPRHVAGWRSGPVGRLLDRLGDRIVGMLIMYEGGKQFRRDVAIWNHRRYLEFPALGASDRGLGTFRRYCRQFYPSPVDAAGATEPGAGARQSRPPGAGRPAPTRRAAVADTSEERTA